jgi:hypothetical protein
MVGPGPLKEMLEWFYREVILVYQVKAFPEGEGNFLYFIFFTKNIFFLLE